MAGGAPGTGPGHGSRPVAGAGRSCGFEDISLENATLQADKGLVCTEANRISLESVSLLTQQTDPVPEVHHRQNITLDGIRYAPGAATLLRVSGVDVKKRAVVVTKK